MPNTPESYALPIKSAHCRGPRELSGESGYFVTPRSNDDCLLPGVGAVPRLIHGSLGPPESIQSVGFTGLAVVSNRRTDRSVSSQT